MYQVILHRIGTNGSYDTLGRLWETGGGYPAFEPVWESRRKADAFAVANLCTIKATVHRNHAAYIEYDNGKEPGRRERPCAEPKTFPLELYLA
jgi:hypothetical protein